MVGRIAIALSLVPAVAWADQEVRFESGFALTVPDDWTAAVVGGDVAFRGPGGDSIATLHWRQMTCGDALDAWAIGMPPGPIAPSDLDVPRGWAAMSYDGDSPQLAFCRQIERDGATEAFMVQAYHAEDALLLVATADRGIDALLAGPVTSSPEPEEHERDAPPRAPRSDSLALGVLSRLVPDRFELGVARLTDGRYDALDPRFDEGWGATLAIERTLYGQGPWLGYRGRITPTSVGPGGYLELALGLGFQHVTVQAVAGVGGAGSSAPFGAHAGGRGALQIPITSNEASRLGLELEGGASWLPGGHLWQLELGFYVARGRRAFTFGIGADDRLDSRILTIDFGLLSLPD